MTPHRILISPSRDDAPVVGSEDGERDAADIQCMPSTAGIPRSTPLQMRLLASRDAEGLALLPQPWELIGTLSANSVSGERELRRGILGLGHALQRIEGPIPARRVWTSTDRSTIFAA